MYQISVACGCNIGKVRANNEDNIYLNGRTLEQTNRGLKGTLTSKHLLDTEPDALLFDVREEEEFITGHPIEAELFTLDTIDAQTAALRIPAKDTPVLVYCRSGVRSREAAQILRALGYRRVYDVGSMVGWPYGSM